MISDQHHSQSLVLDNLDPEEQFQIQDLIGEGAYGCVYKAIHKKTGRVVAVKIVPSSGEIMSLQKEIQILKECKSEYIVKYFGSYYKDENLWLVMEFCAAGSVIDLMKICKHQLSEQEIASILFYALKGIEYLHANKKIHRDIKAGNILLDNQGSAKLADFGVSAQLLHTNADKETKIGTPFWMSPEVISKHKYNQLTDIWSLGITAVELAEGQPPYSHIHPMRALFVIRNNPPKGLTDPSKWSKQFNEFVQSCLRVEVIDRPTATQLLQTPFIKMGASETKRLAVMVQNSLQDIEIYRQNKQNERNDPNQEEQQGDPQTMIHKNTLGNYSDNTINNSGTMVEQPTTLVIKQDEKIQNKELDFVSYAKGIKMVEDMESKKEQKVPKYDSYYSQEEEEDNDESVHDTKQDEDVDAAELSLDQMSEQEQERFLAYLRQKMQAEIDIVKDKYVPKIKEIEQRMQQRKQIQQPSTTPKRMMLEQNLLQIINLPFNFQVNQELIEKLQSIKMPQLDLKVQQSSQLRSNPKQKPPFEFIPMLQKK